MAAKKPAEIGGGRSTTLQIRDWETLDIPISSGDAQEVDITECDHFFISVSVESHIGRGTDNTSVGSASSRIKLSAGDSFSSNCSADKTNKIWVRSTGAASSGGLSVVTWENR